MQGVNPKLLIFTFDAKALQEFHRTHALVCAEHYQWTDEQSVMSLHCAQLLRFSITQVSGGSDKTPTNQ